MAPGRQPPAFASKGPIGPSDIVLLEESDLYRYHDSNDLVLDSSQSHPHHYQLQQQRVPSSNDGPTQNQYKYGRDTRSNRSNSTTAPYIFAGTPYPPSTTTKHTASSDMLSAQYGAIRPGGSVLLFSRDYIGLLLNWMVTGFFNGAIPGLVYPLFGAYLNFSNTQQNATFTLLNFGWYFKFLFGFISDNYPINRQRRKPYIFIGWTLLAGFMLAVSFMNKVQPFQIGEEIVNEDAPSQGSRYVIPILIASLAHYMADSACEGVMVELSHLEGEYDRGRTQIWCFAFRFIGEVLGGTFATLGLNSELYGGSFANAVPIQLYFASLAVVALIGNAVTYFLLKDEKVPSTRQSFGSSVRKVWRFMEKRATIHVMVGSFLVTIGISFQVLETGDMFTFWMATDSLAMNLVYVVQTVGYLIASYAVYRWLLNSSWHLILVVSCILLSLIQLPIELLTIWGVVRSSTLFLTKDCIGSIFEAFIWIVSSLVFVEVADPGLESTSYGLLATVCNLGNALVQSSYNIAASSWEPETIDVEADTGAVRWHLTYEYILKDVGRLLFVLLSLIVFPRQKRAVTETKMRGDPNIVIPIVMLVVLGGLFVAAATSALLAMFESTMCLPFAGGSGCGNE